MVLSSNHFYTFNTCFIITRKKTDHLLSLVSRSKLNKATAHMLTLVVYNKSNTDNISNIFQEIDAVKVDGRKSVTENLVREGKWELKVLLTYVIN